MCPISKFIHIKKLVLVLIWCYFEECVCAYQTCIAGWIWSSSKSSGKKLSIKKTVHTKQVSSLQSYSCSQETVKKEMCPLNRMHPWWWVYLYTEFYGDHWTQLKAVQGARSPFIFKCWLRSSVDYLLIKEPIHVPTIWCNQGTSLCRMWSSEIAWSHIGLCPSSALPLLSPGVRR